MVPPANHSTGGGSDGGLLIPEDSTPPRLRGLLLLLLGALLEEQFEVDSFLARFRDFPLPIDRVLSRLGDAERVSDSAYWAALVRAYPDPPAHMREWISNWERDEDPRHLGVLDSLLDTRATLHKLMRVARVEYQHGFVELLERERESVAAQAAVALERADNRESVRAD